MVDNKNSLIFDLSNQNNMKTILVKVQMQFDQFSNENSEQFVMSTIDRINSVLQKEFSDISPIIFGNNIDSSDIEVVNVDDTEN